MKAYEHFNDPEWDGEPLEPVVSKPSRPDTPESVDTSDSESSEPEEGPKKIKIKLADGKERIIQHMMATSYWSPDGKPISANQMVEKLFGELPRFFKDEDELRRLWSKPDTRKALLLSLSEKGFGEEQLLEISRMINAEKSDVFDVLGYIAFALAPITRSERVETRRSDIFSRYHPELQAFSRLRPRAICQAGGRRAGPGKARSPDPAQVSHHRRCGGAARQRADHSRHVCRVSTIPI